MRFARIAAVSSLVIATTAVTGAEVNVFNYKCRGVEIQATQGSDNAGEKRRVATDGYLLLESKPGLVTPILVQLRDRAYYSVTELETVELRRQNTQGNASFVLSGSNLALMGPAFGTTPTTLAGYTAWQRQLKDGGTNSGYAKITLTHDRKLTAAFNTRRIGGKRLSSLLAEESLDDEIAKVLGLQGFFSYPTTRCLMPW